MATNTPAGQLVRAFGNVAAMSALYAADVEWSLSASLPFPRPMLGKEAVVAFNTAVWTVHFHPDCTVEILDEVGDAASSAARFIYRAHSKITDQPYENEYTVFVRSGPTGITHVFEALDTALICEFLQGQPAGSSFAFLSDKAG